MEILLYHKNFVTRFQLNTYDLCIENWIVKYKKQTIRFHVDDLKLRHKDSEVKDEFIDTLRNEYKSLFGYGSGKMKVN